MSVLLTPVLTAIGSITAVEELGLFGLGFVGVIGGCFISVLYAAPGGAIIGLGHYALRGLMLRALSPVAAGQEPNPTRYYLINLFYGMAVSLPVFACGAVSALFTVEVPENSLALSAPVVMIAFGICSLVIGEILKPKFERYIAAGGSEG